MGRSVKQGDWGKARIVFSLLRFDLLWCGFLAVQSAMIKSRVYDIPENTNEFLPKIELFHLDVPPHGIFHPWMSTDLP